MDAGTIFGLLAGVMLLAILWPALHRRQAGGRSPLLMLALWGAIILLLMALYNSFHGRF